jgi:hypothetical protein
MRSALPAAAKKYILTIAVVLIIAATLGTYYGYAADERLPAYRLATLEGDSAEAEPIILSGSYGGRMRSKYLDVTSEGSHYTNNVSVIEQWSGTRSWLYSYSGLKQLREDYPGFMRGKGDPEGFYKDDDDVVYVNAKLLEKEGVIEWTLDRLELSGGRKSQVKSRTTVDKNVAYLSIRDVQKIGEDVHVLTHMQFNPASGRSADIEYIDFILSAEEGSEIRTQEIPFEPVQREGYLFEAQGVTSRNVTAASDRVLFVTSESKITENAEMPDVPAASATEPSIPVDERLYSYEYASGKLEEIPDLGIERSDEFGSYLNYAIEGDLLTVSLKEDKRISLWTYDMASGQKGNHLELAADELGTDQIHNAAIADGRIYLLLRTTENPLAAVADATNGRILYKGQVVCDDPKRETEEQIKLVRLLNLQLK